MSKTYKAALLDAMQEAMDNNPHSLIIGQGVSDFKGIVVTVILGISGTKSSILFIGTVKLFELKSLNKNICPLRD